MTLDKLIVSIVSVIGIALTYWFFLLKKETETEVTDSIDIVVEGGYNPQNIVIKKGVATKINFLRKDPSSCLEEVVIADFRIKKYLPMNKKVTIELNPDKAGEFTISCGMNMYHGKIIVK
ncbi:MAG TPA: cupredoxin domain-containing protein [Candidatus Saccharimonadales bacterium]|nr:cupredoxin domain-containing protein [Candidatus Saccharimonadales bacterium]